MHRLLSSGQFELYIGLQSFLPILDDNNIYASLAAIVYKTFRIGPEQDGYRLTIGDTNISGSPFDAMSQHNGMKFTTFDRDNDNCWREQCARRFRAGWWYNCCHSANLNGVYYNEGFDTSQRRPEGIVWDPWLGDRQSLKTVVMAVRPIAN